MRTRKPSVKVAVCRGAERDMLCQLVTMAAYMSPADFQAAMNTRSGQEISGEPLRRSVAVCRVIHLVWWRWGDERARTAADMRIVAHAASDLAAPCSPVSLLYALVCAELWRLGFGPVVTGIDVGAAHEDSGDAAEVESVAKPNEGLSAYQWRLLETLFEALGPETGVTIMRRATLSRPPIKALNELVRLGLARSDENGEPEMWRITDAGRRRFVMGPKEPGKADTRNQNPDQHTTGLAAREYPAKRDTPSGEDIRRYGASASSDGEAADSGRKPARTRTSRRAGP